MIKQAEWIAGLELTDDEPHSHGTVGSAELELVCRARKVDIAYDVPPALTFFPVAPRPAAAVKRNQAVPVETPVVRRPGSAEELAFLSVVELSVLVRSRQVSSMELTKLYLERLKRFDPLLKCVVTLTEDVAFKQAAQADREIAAGQYRGVLHGIPWGAKDLIAYPGYPTTWGATPYKSRVLDGKATVATRLEEAGSVLIAKLSMGALAMGDLWFGGAGAAHGTRAAGRAAVRRDRHPRRPRGLWGLRSGPRHWEASSRPAVRAERPACGRPLAA